MNAVAKIETASVTQNTAIRTETAAAFIAIGFMPVGTGAESINKKAPIPKTKPNFFLMLSAFILQKDTYRQLALFQNCHAQHPER